MNLCHAGISLSIQTRSFLKPYFCQIVAYTYWTVSCWLNLMLWSQRLLMTPIDCNVYNQTVHVFLYACEKFTTVVYTRILSFIYALCGHVFGVLGYQYWILCVEATKDLSEKIIICILSYLWQIFASPNRMLIIVCACITCNCIPLIAIPKGLLANASNSENL